MAGASKRGATLADEHRFLHARVRLCIRILFGFFAIFSVLGLVKWLSLPDAQYGEIKHEILPGIYGFGSVTALLAAFAVIVGKPHVATRTLHLIDSAGVVCACAASGTLSLLMPTGVPQAGAFLLVILVLVVRAAVVPSTVRRTAIVGLLSTATLSVFLWIRTLDLPPREDLLIDYDRFTWALGLGWGIIFTVATAIVSRVIYGLQKTARDAMRLGNYTLDRKLGEGGMGTVYLARHALLQRPTALKLLRPEKAGETAVVRFEREVQQTSRLAHPNTVQIFDFGRTPDGIFYYVMEYLDGVDLQELVELDGPQPAGRVIYILAQIAHALAEAHRGNLVHRDIKPANVILCNRGGVADMAKVVDFGLVKHTAAPAGITVSSTNIITGTPLYLAPECLTNPETIDGRSDLYALGSVGYFLLTGETVFDGDSVMEVCSQHLHSEPIRPSERADIEISEELEQVILRCLAKQPVDRYPDATTLRAALLACPEADGWGMERAQAWWDEHGERVQAFRAKKHARLDTGVSETIAVSLDGKLAREARTGR